MSANELHRIVGIPVFVANSEEAIAKEVAGRIASLVRRRAEEGRSAVLGLATGSTPRGVYRELVRLRADEGLDMAHVVTFNLDEYYPMEPAHPESYHRYMREHLFDHVNVPDESIHIPSGTVAARDVEEHCAAYEEAIRAAGGIDFQLLGIGRDGHIGFNEPGSAGDSRTRMIDLDPVTRRDAADDFGGLDAVPTHAITMGVATIMEAREVVLVALGAHKADVVLRAATGPVRNEIVATFLHEHPSAEIILDPPAADALAAGARSGEVRGREGFA